MSKKTRQMKKVVIIASVLLVAGLIWAAASRPPASGALQGQKAVVYREASCGCCANYISYLRRSGAEVEEKIVNNIASRKGEFGVPRDLSSCHTTLMDGYTIEGHIPVEAIQKLLADKPAVAGIALPLMPSGSPGMPGAKTAPFEISSFDSDGLSSPYLSL